MIKAAINREYPHHLSGCTTTHNSLFVADYSNKTKYIQPKRGSELFTTPPTDIDYFTLNNNVGLQITGIAFDNKSFTRKKNPLPQCECVVFPAISTTESWILFAELKYCAECNNEQDLNKARRQLFKTQYYYKSKGIFNKTNRCYLLRMKEKHNVIIRFKNSVEILDNEVIDV